MAMRTPRIEEHPDLMTLRAGSERVATLPSAQALECLSLLAGLYLAVSPWIVGFYTASRTMTVNDLITGIALAVVALGFGPAYERTHGMGWAAALIGVWTIIAPWIVSGSPTTNGIVISNVVAGGVVVLLALATSAMGARAAAERV